MGGELQETSKKVKLTALSRCNLRKAYGADCHWLHAVVDTEKRPQPCDIQVVLERLAELDKIET